MRNFGYLFGTVAIAATMCACSDDATNDVTAAGTETATGDVTYLNVSLAMAGSGSLTRSTGDYDYGEAYENAVKTCTLLFYDEEGNFLTLSELDDDLGWSTEETGKNIASTASQVVALSGLSTKPTQVLAIINGTASDYNNESLDNVLAMTVDENDANLTSLGEGDFIMSNSVYVGEDGTFVYAEPIDKDCLYETYEAAESGESVTIYVEREVAKVTINVNVNTGDDDSSASNIEKDDDGTYYAELDGTHIIYIGENATDYTDATFRICIDGWAVNATNEKGYLVKNVSDVWLSDPDFASGTWYNSTDYRTWWAKDDNYENNDGVSYLSWQEVADNGTSTDAAYYHENTANYDVQTEYNQPGTDAYTPTLMVAAHVEVSTDEDFSDILDGGNLYYKGGEYYDEAALKYYIAKEYNEANSGSVTADEIEISFDDDEEEVICTINGTEYSADDLNILEDMKFFEESACYYQEPISQKITSGDIDDSVDSSDATTEYCGLVRNHSYKITLNSITGVGGNIPEKGDEDGEPEIPGEETTYYLNATINILQWRVVEQEVNF